jgi:hypothetical protein
MKRIILCILFLIISVSCSKHNIGNNQEIKEATEPSKGDLQEGIQSQQEEEEFDLIYYSVRRYSEDGKFVVPGKFILTPATPNKLSTHDLENRGYNADLDADGFVVDTSFFGGVPPTGKFDIYSVSWERGKRDKPLKVELAHHNISLGW